MCLLSSHAAFNVFLIILYIIHKLPEVIFMKIHNIFLPTHNSNNFIVYIFFNVFF